MQFNINIFNSFKSKLYSSLVLITLVITFGTIGYTMLSDVDILDALYMTIITMSTVGFREIEDFGASEKLFTIVLILVSIVVYGYSVASLTEYLASSKIFQRLKLRKVQQSIQNLKNHSVVCGYGRNGKQAVAKLKKFHVPCVIIEKDKELIEELDAANMLYVEGDATNDNTLLKAGLKDAKNLITALPSDADNLFVVFSARQLNNNLTIISRASTESSDSKLRMAGANNIIMPDKIGGDHMASLVVTPDLVEFIDKLTISEECTTNLVEIAIDDLPQEFLNKTITDLDLRKKTGCTVIGFKSVHNTYLINPEANTKLTKGSNLILLGRPEQIQKLHEVY
jgi:voltage-gated potassium channel